VPVLKVAELSILPLGNLTPLFSFPFPKSNWSKIGYKR
jgi:hypothetical protein